MLFISTIFLFEFQEGIIGEEKTKVSRTLAEALISSRLHRPRSDPLGASLPSNWNPRERWEKENRRKVPYLIFHIGGAAWIFLRVCKASRKRYPATVERIFLSSIEPGASFVARKTGNRIQLLSIGILTVRLLSRVEQWGFLARESSMIALGENRRRGKNYSDKSRDWFQIWCKYNFNYESYWRNATKLCDWIWIKISLKLDCSSLIDRWLMWNLLLLRFNRDRVKKYYF